MDGRTSYGGLWCVSCATETRRGDGGIPFVSAEVSQLSWKPIRKGWQGVSINQAHNLPTFTTDTDTPTISPKRSWHKHLLNALKFFISFPPLLLSHDEDIVCYEDNIYGKMDKEILSARLELE